MTIQKVTPPKGNELILTTALTAVPANIPAKSTVVIGGASLTQAQIVTQVTTLLAPFQAARAAKLAFTAAVLARKQNDPAVQTFVAEFKAAIISLFGRSSPILAQFGFTPHKARSPTSGGKNVVRAAKVQATRAKLGTKGPQQKAQLLAQQPPAFTVSSTGEVTLVGGGASSTAPAPAASNTATSTAGSTPASAAGSTTPSAS